MSEVLKQKSPFLLDDLFTEYSILESQRRKLLGRSNEVAEDICRLKLLQEQLDRRSQATRNQQEALVSQFMSSEEEISPIFRALLENNQQPTSTTKDKLIKLNLLYLEYLKILDIKDRISQLDHPEILFGINFQKLKINDSEHRPHSQVVTGANIQAGIVNSEADLTVDLTGLPGQSLNEILLAVEDHTQIRSRTFSFENMFGEDVLLAPPEVKKDSTKFSIFNGGGQIILPSSVGEISLDPNHNNIIFGKELAFSAFQWFGYRTDMDRGMVTSALGLLDKY